MKVSVVVPTYRLGGLDVLFHGLKNQTMQDFELVLVDTIHRYRRQVVADYAKKLGLDGKIVHIPPPDGYGLPIRHIAPALNQGMAKSSGDLLVLWSDYCYPMSNCLEKHWETYIKSDRKSTTAGSYDYISAPVLKPNLNTILNSRMSIKAYMSLVESRSDDLGVSIFAKEFTPPGLSELKITNILGMTQPRYSMEIDYRKMRVGEPAPWYAWYSKNPSFPRDLCLKVGGLDPDLGGWHDEFDFGLRLARIGHRMVYNPTNRVFVMSYVDTFPSTITVLKKPASYQTWVRKQTGHGEIRFRTRLSATDVLKLKIRLVLTSPRMARLLKESRLEHLAIMLIYSFSLGAPELRYVDDKAWLSRY